MLGYPHLGLLLIILDEPTVNPNSSLATLHDGSFSLVTLDG